jgi:hypothetical protein
MSIIFRLIKDILFNLRTTQWTIYSFTTPGQCVVVMYKNINPPWIIPGYATVRIVPSTCSL